jgi:SAM-dependent methyltransferase
LSLGLNNVSRFSDEAAQGSDDGAWSARLKRIKNCLVCPSCRGDLTFEPEAVKCQACAALYPVKNDKINFIPSLHSNDARDSLLGHLRRRMGNLYYIIGVNIISPDFPFNFKREIYRHLDPSQQLVLDIGSGNHRISPDVITVDQVDYDNADLVCDLSELPIKPGSIDAFVSNSVLEHVHKFEAMTKRLSECTRPGGLGIHQLPFMYPFHASPHDYRRLTHAGVRDIFGEWEILEQYNVAGPVTLFLICFVEFLSVIASFGRPTLKYYFYLLFCLLLFPIKFLDAPFIKRKAFLGMAPKILTVFRKP